MAKTSTPFIKGIEILTNIVGNTGITRGSNASGSVFIGGRRDVPELTAEQLIAGYKKFPWLRMVIDKISELAGEMEWRVAIVEDITEEGEEKLKFLPDHPLAKLLNRGNSEFSGLAMRQLAFKELCILGEVAWIKEFDKRGKEIKELWPLPTTWIKELPIQNEKGKFKIKVGGNEGLVDPKRIIYIRIPDPSNPYLRGTGPAGTLTDELATDELMARYTKQFFFNSARPDLLIWSEDSENPMNEDDSERLEETWLSKVQGFLRSHRPLFLPGKVGIKDISSKLSDLNVDTFRTQSKDAVMQMYGLPPEILGRLENSNRCLDSETQCLTRRGWVDHFELSETDEIATFNPETECVEYHNPTHIYEYDYEGKLHQWKTKTVDFVCTPNHRMWVKSQFRGKWHIEESSDLANKQMQYVWRATGGFPDNQGKRKLHIVQQESGTHKYKEDYELTFDTLIFARFLGYWISEGSSSSKKQDYRIRLCQNEGIIADKMYQCLKDLNLGSIYTHKRESKCANGTPGNTLLTFSTSNKSVSHWLKNNVGTSYYDKRIPKEAFSWSKEAQEELLRALIEGGGSSSQERTKSSAEYADRYYSTVSKDLADDIQQLCVQIGIRSSQQSFIPKDHYGSYGRLIENCSRIYIVGISSKQNYYVTTTTERDNKTPTVQNIDYKGKVWCVNVPNHLFFTRRNGKIALHGNSTISAAEFFLTKHVVTPKLRFLKAELDRTLVVDFDTSGKLRLVFENPITESKEMQAQLVRHSPFAFSIDDIRKIADMPPLGGQEGKVHGLPVNFFFTDNLEDVIEQSPESNVGEDSPEEEDDQGNERTMPVSERRGIALMSHLIAEELKKDDGEE